MRPIFSAFLGFFLLATLSLSTACQMQESQARIDQTPSGLPTKDSLYQSLQNQRSIRLVVPDQSPLAGQYRSVAETIRERSRFREIILVDASDLSDSLCQAGPMIIVGSKKHIQQLGGWTQSLPFSPTRAGFSFQETAYQETNHSLVHSWYPHPLWPSCPLAWISGNSDTTVLHILKDQARRRRSLFGWGGWDFQIFEGKDKRLIGNYTNTWKPNPEVRWTFDGDLKPATTNQAARIFCHLEVDPEWSEVMADSLLQRQKRWKAWLGDATDTLVPLPVIDYHLWDHPEDMGLSQGNMATGIREGVHIHRLIHPAFVKQDPGLEWAFWMEASFGQPSRQVLLNGLRVFLTSDFQRLGYLSLAASLIRAEGKVSVEVIFEPAAYERESPLVRDCYAGAIVAFLQDYLGKKEFIRQYRSFDPAIITKEFATAWDEYQARLLSETPKRRGFSSLPGYFKGMTFAHEGYRVFDGYGSRRAEHSLNHLSQIGCNAMAIVPYTGTSNPQSKEPLRWSRSAGSENDASVILSHYGTHASGMVTMLKPQVWVRGGWPGDVNMPDEEDWEVWFDHYHRWIRHYAVLAEIHQMDILCLGTEFRYATLKHPDRWRNLVTKIREIYHGTITYAANWGEEVENLGFADILDFVGVNCYYPLSTKDSPSDEELTQSMQQTLQMLDQLSRQWEIPYVLTEIGYRSIDKPWQHPHADAGDAEANEEHQARCYRAVLSNLPGHPACKGLFWWKWPSYEQYAQRNPRSFTPYGKSAQDILQEAYQSW